MKIRKVWFENFMPFAGKHEISLDGIDAIGITAEYENAPERSNRSGKTAFIEIFRYLFYGVSRASTETELIYDGGGAKEMRVGGEIEWRDGIITKIVRGRTKTGDPILEVEGAEDASMASSNAALLERLKMAEEDFQRTTYCTQGEIAALAADKPAERKRAVMRWLEQAHWEILEAKAKGRIKNVETEVYSLESKMRDLQKRSEGTVELHEGIEEVRKDREEVEREVEKCQQRVSKLEGILQEVEDLDDLRRQAKRIDEDLEEADSAPTLRKRLRQVCEECSEVEAEIEERQQRVSKLEGILQEVEDLDDLRRQAKRIDEDLEEADTVLSIQTSLKQAREDRTRAEGIADQLAEMNKELTKCGEKMSPVRLDLQKWEALCGEGFDGQCPIDDKDCPRTEEINQDRQKAEAERTSLQDILQVLKDKKRVIGERYAEVDRELDILLKGAKRAERDEERLKRAERLEAEREDLEARLERVREKMKVAREAVDTALELRDAKEALSRTREDTKRNAETAGKLEEKIEVAERLEAEREDLEARLERVREKMKLARETADTEYELRTAKADLGEARQKARERDETIGRLEEQVRAAERAKEEIEETDQERRRLLFLLSRLRVVRLMFSKDGVPAMQARSTFLKLEVEANEVLRSIEAPMRVRFSFERELKKWEASCRICGTRYEKGHRKDSPCKQCGEPRRRATEDTLDIEVEEDGITRSLEQDSGGGKTLIALALRIALSRLLKARTGAEADVLFLDEVFGQLDPPNRDAVSRFLARLPELGFSQVFVISHDRDIQEAMPHNLVIRRGRSSSTVAWAS